MHTYIHRDFDDTTLKLIISACQWDIIVYICNLSYGMEES